MTFVTMLRTNMQKTKGKSHRPVATAPEPAAQDLLREVGHLCAIGLVPEEAAIELLRAGFRRRIPSASPKCRDDGDVFAASQILSEWHENSLFLDKDGLPASLSISLGAFNELCDAAAVSSDRLKLLGVLVDAGAATRKADIVRATRRELILGDGHPAGAARAIRMSREFVATLNHNLTIAIGEPRRFERSVLSNKLPVRQVPALLAYLSVHGQSFLEDLDSWVSAREATKPSASVGVGVYLFVDSNSD